MISSKLNKICIIITVQQVQNHHRTVKLINKVSKDMLPVNNKVLEGRTLHCNKHSKTYAFMEDKCEDLTAAVIAII